MSNGTGGGVMVPEVSVGTPPGHQDHWSTRVLAAFGGAVVVVSLLVLGSAWTTGLRPSTLETLRSDIASGNVIQWYVASSVETGPGDFAHPQQAGLSDGSTDSLGVDDGSVVTPEGFPGGGIMVWRTRGGTGWSVASPNGVVGPSTWASPTEETVQLVRQLREAKVPMKPFQFSERMTLDVVHGLFGLLLLGRLVFGPATRVGTKWFWFWLVVVTPLQIGVIAYAVTELVGLRWRPDRPLDRRRKGLAGLVGGIIVAVAVGATLELLRSRGAPIPL